MSNHLRYAGFLAVLMFASMSGAQRKVIPAVRPSWADLAKEKAPDESSPLKRSIRQARSDAFNDKTGLKPKLDDLSTKTTEGSHYGVGASYDHGYLAPLPVDVAPVVALGKVLTAQPYFSSDHTAIYTELRVQIEKTLKDEGGLVSSNSSLDVVEHGGALSVNGIVVREPVDANKGQIDVGNRYVLFLRPKPSALNTFTLIRAWRLVSGHPEPTHAYKVNNQEEVCRYTSMSEADFVSHIQQAIESGSTH